MSIIRKQQQLWLLRAARVLILHIQFDKKDSKRTYYWMTEGLVIFTICWLNITNQQQNYSNPLIRQPTTQLCPEKNNIQSFKIEIVV
jgi:hypothetical protein